MQLMSQRTSQSAAWMPEVDKQPVEYSTSGQASLTRCASNTRGSWTSSRSNSISHPVSASITHLPPAAASTSHSFKGVPEAPTAGSLCATTIMPVSLSADGSNLRSDTGGCMHNSSLQLYSSLGSQPQAQAQADQRVMTQGPDSHPGITSLASYTGSNSQLQSPEQPTSFAVRHRCTPAAPPLSLATLTPSPSPSPAISPRLPSLALIGQQPAWDLPYLMRSRSGRVSMPGSLAVELGSHQAVKQQALQRGGSLRHSTGGGGLLDSITTSATTTPRAKLASSCQALTERPHTSASGSTTTPQLTKQGAPPPSSLSRAPSMPRTSSDAGSWAISTMTTPMSRPPVQRTTSDVVSSSSRGACTTAVGSSPQPVLLATAGMELPPEWAAVLAAFEQGGKTQESEPESADQDDDDEEQWIKYKDKGVARSVRTQFGRLSSTLRTTNWAKSLSPGPPLSSYVPDAEHFKRKALIRANQEARDKALRSGSNFSSGGGGGAGSDAATKVRKGLA